jgi:16S rRNA C1402 N4-methylase RsmH
VRLLTKHVVTPGREETGSNPPSRSAKLRAVEMG